MEIKSLSKDFMALIALSCLIAAPVAYYFFTGGCKTLITAQRSSGGSSPPTGGAAMFITLLTGSYQTLKEDPTTLNTIRVFFDNITGDDVLCTNYEDYVLEDTIPGKSTSWFVTPTYLFGSSTSGSGNTATLKAASSTTSGEATLTFEMSDGCSIQEGERTIWVGIPGLNTATVDGETPTTPTYIDNPAYLVVTAKGSPSSYSWAIESGSGSIYPSGNTCVAYAYPFVVVKATATNVCGSNAIYYFYLQQSGSPRLPANIQVTARSIGQYRIDFMTDLSEMQLNGLSVADQFGRIVKIYEKNELESLIEVQAGIDIDLSFFPVGVYYFTLYSDKNVTTKKLVHW